jgi:broad specificity phosphatase PhoE
MGRAAAGGPLAGERRGGARLGGGHRRLPASFGETFQSLEARVARFASRIPGGPGDVLVVAHRGPLAILHGLLTGQSLESSWKLPLDQGSLIGVERHRSG